MAAARGDRKLAEVREIFTEQSSIATSNLLGATGVALGQILYDDPARQPGFAKMFVIVGETILAHGEAVKTKAEGRQYTPGAHITALAVQETLDALTKIVAKLPFP